MQSKFFKVTMAVFLLLAFASVAAAAGNNEAASVTQKGNLLVFPLVQNKGGYTAPTVYTNIYIGNDSASAVNVKCYWMDHLQLIEDFYFTITKNQSIVFSTANSDYGPPFDKEDNGSLVCWAQDDNDRFPETNAATRNALFGSAEIVNTVTKANVFYNATSFFTKTGVVSECYDDTGAVVSCASTAAIAAKIALDGNTNWDACPQYLVESFIPDNATLAAPTGVLTKPHPGIAIWPCKQDLRQDRAGTYTKLKFDIWNWDEVKFTGSYRCIKCFYEGLLKDIEATSYGYGAEKFTYEDLGGFVATLRITGVASNASVCGTASLTSPLLGFLYYANDTGTEPVAGHTMHGAGRMNSGFVKYDLGGAYAESAGK